MTNLDERIADLRKRQDVPEHEDTPSFNAPWQARAFAAVVRLHRKDLFEWNEFQTRLIERIQSTEWTENDDVEAVYYRNWIEAAEQLLRDRGVFEGEEFARRVREFESGERDASEFAVGVEHAHAHTHDRDSGH